MFTIRYFAFCIGSALSGVFLGSFAGSLIGRAPAWWPHYHPVSWGIASVLSIVGTIGLGIEAMKEMGK